ncbi:MAG: DUF5655 domain-containing protein [Clostridiales bacterium]|nr:DUF5655 domain-containing protein [Clostridiales bacterium]MDY4009248.1 DUF5655 domain-containing protein [Candidatus Limiplasma sp.]
MADLPGRAEAALFFANDSDAFALFLLLHGQLLAAWPKSALKVQKTQITFLDPRGYCFVWLPRRGPGSLGVSFGLGYELKSPRLFQVAHPTPRRWTHHVIVTRPAQLDGELLDWLSQAHALMWAGRLRRAWARGIVAKPIP